MYFFTKTPVRILISAVALLLVGIAIGFWAIPRAPAAAARSEIRQYDHTGRLTNQLLECAELPETITVGTRINLEKEIRDILDARIKEGKLADAAVYFRDLNNGPWMGIHEEQLFHPASLLKLPLAMAFHWHAENEPGLLTGTAIYEKASDDYEAGQAFGSTKRLENGGTYAVGDLIDFMLQESSNEAALILSQIAGQERVLGVYKDLGVTPPAYGQDYEINVHTFASFFRILYNATYLNRTSSEHLLDAMTHSSFTQGLVAGVPSGTTVAHKFGTREVDAEGNHQLHDCGIVYAGDTPYILCIMTKGKNFDHLVGFIKDVSALVFKTVSS
jgi:beta-lactamase class A